MKIRRQVQHRNERRPGAAFTPGLPGVQTANREVGEGGDGGGIPPP
jgi:hypothetical protein